MKMNWVNNQLVKYSSLNYLRTYIHKIESTEDTSVIIDYSKSLLESISKTILGDIGYKSTKSDPSLNSIVKETANQLILDNKNDSKKKIINAFATFASGVAELRNNEGVIAHGRDLHKIKTLPLIFAKLVAQSVDVVGGFFLEYHYDLFATKNKKRIIYDDYQNFNDYYDELYEPYKIAGLTTVLASKITYDYDFELYHQELLDYEEQENIHTESEEKDIKLEDIKDIKLEDIKDIKIENISKEEYAIKLSSMINRKDLEEDIKNILNEYLVTDWDTKNSALANLKIKFKELIKDESIENINPSELLNLLIKYKT